MNKYARSTSFDARGKTVYSFSRLKEANPSFRGQELLQRYLLSGLIVHPAIEIRIPKKFYGTIEVRHFGVCPDALYTKEISGKALAGLRRLWVNAVKRGWKRYELPGVCVLAKDPVITRDPLRRYS